MAGIELDSGQAQPVASQVTPVKLEPLEVGGRLPLVMMIYEDHYDDDYEHDDFEDYDDDDDDDVRTRVV